MRWLQRLMRKAEQPQSKGTPGSPGGGNVGAPIFPGQSSIFTPERNRRRRNVNKKKYPESAKGRSWNDTSQM